VTTQYNPYIKVIQSAYSYYNSIFIYHITLSKCYALDVSY